MFFKAFILAVLVNAALAFIPDLIGRGNPVATATKEINETCLALAEAGSCEFYTCFEARLSCGRRWYIEKHGRYYCNRMESHREDFSPSGQVFIDNAKQCLTQSLQGHYVRDFVDCHALEHDAVAAISPCFTENGFCPVLQEDHDQLFNIYEVGDLFTRGAGKLWQVILRLSATCGGQMVQEFSSDASETILNGLNDFFGSIASLADKRK